MRTVMRNPFLSGVHVILGGAFLWAGVAGADVASDRPAALLVVPKVVYNTDPRYSPNLKPSDTEIQITNVSEEPIKVKCFYVNANAHCSNNPLSVCYTNADCQQFGLGGLCFAGWIETDFEFTLSPNQPIVWRAGEGLTNLPLADTGQNEGSIPAVSEDPFRGELKCIAVGPDDEPVDRNDLKGEATIVAASADGIDARAYNAIGIQALPDANNGDNTLVIGGEDDPEYNGCPAVVIVDHFYDDAVEPIDGDILKSHLTCVPCSQNFEFQTVALFPTTLQFLLFNEFEQRFSASRPLRCWAEWELCSIDQKWDRPIGNFDPEFNSCQRSIFSAFVSGTLTGQFRVRGVDDGSDEHGNGVLCVLEEFFRTTESLSSIRSSTAANTHQIGERSDTDFWEMP